MNGGSPNRYSYTRYDALGRIIEAGEKSGGTDITTIDTKDDNAVQTWLASGADSQVTRTLYDDVNTTMVTNPGITDHQANLRKRVASTLYFEDGSGSYDAATHYSYDVAGNVQTLWQDIPALQAIDAGTGLKRTDYAYDVISGKVNQVSYQPGKGDQFYYRYDYDADNRVIAAATSRDGLVWHNDASYRYYLHGPLARMELGTNKVQGVDYAYTLQGWLKGINSNFLGAGKDMAGDGLSSTIYAPFARDVYSLSLGYYDYDYRPVDSANAPAFALRYTAPGTLAGSGNQLYNGNISNSTLSLFNLDGGVAVGYSYGYDQLNRLLFMRQHGITANVTSWDNSDIINDYKEDIAYDANGNILKYLRNGTTQGSNPLGMDSLTYYYNDKTNQLNTIHDSVPANNYSNDLDDESTNNYAYDSIGNMIQDNAAGISDITWTVYGKVKQVSKTGTTLNFSYNASGNRIIKDVTGTNANKQFYIRDAQGNILAIYSYDGTTLKWAEQDLYGSSRLGTWDWDSTIPGRTMVPQSETDTLSDWYVLGTRNYELDNHLGNVMSVITDKKIGVTSDGSTVDYYRAEVLSQGDYYPFGMEEPYRQYSIGDSYRYGFNGKEMDNEVKGNGNQYDYGFRIYDPRSGRFLSTDPLTKKYPELTPYQFASNRPIDGIDFDGLEHISFFVRSYEHSPVFATPFTSLGDDRTASTASSASARIHYKLDIKADENKLEKYIAWSSPSVQLNYPFAPFVNPKVDIAAPKYEASSDGKGNYNFKASAAEPIMSKLPLVGRLTPDIDIKGAINMNSKDGILSIKGQIRGDAFPDAETFIKDNSGQAILLGTYNHGATGSPLWSLPGEGNKKMIDVNVQVKLNKEGDFEKAWSVDKKGNKTPLTIVAPEKKEAGNE